VILWPSIPKHHQGEIAVSMTESERRKRNAATRAETLRRQRAEFKAQLARVESDNITRDVRARMEKHERDLSKL
jgi:hypothetical protein